MNKFLLQATCVLAVGTVPCLADEIVLDPLHGYCGGTGQCIDNGINTPTTNNPPQDFGFTISPGPGTGALWLDFLIPDNAPSALSENFMLTGTLTGQPKLFSSTPWTGGFLDAYLGVSASPSNGIGAYLPSVTVVDPGATGFFVYQISFPNVTLQDSSNPNISPLENFAAGDSAFPIGSYITGFLYETTARDPHWIADANSGAIFEDADPPGTVPEPSSVVLLGSAALGLTAWLRKTTRNRA